MATVIADQASHSGAPQRSAASTALWAHLLRKDIPISFQRSSSSTPKAPPIAPLDKSGTTMRILLHDTRANLEKFSSRVDILTNGVCEAKSEIVTMQKLFQEDHEKIIEQTVELVNRCQNEVQKSFGTPAQAQKLEELHSEVHLTKIQFVALEKRIDCLQTLSNAQSQALQTQSQALQMIQDQQGKIMTALLPLLPLLQAVPLHIDAVKDKITERINNAQVIRISRDSENLISSGTLSSPAPPSEPVPFKRKRSSIALNEDSSDMDVFRPSNRIRVSTDNDPVVLSPTSTRVSQAPVRPQPVGNPVRGYTINNSRLALSNSVAPTRTSSIQIPTSRRTSSKNQIMSSDKSHGSLTSSASKNLNSQTPRRPLADLFRSKNSGSGSVSPEARRGVVTQLNTATFSFNPLVAQSTSSHITATTPTDRNLAAPQNQVQVQTLTDSLIDPATNSDGSSSPNASPTIAVVTLASKSTNGTSGSSTDPISTSGLQSVPALAREHLNEMENDSFLVPMIRPMVMQRSWTSAKAITGKRFIPLDDDDDDEDIGFG